jgi:hypothetical protein
MRLRFLFAAAIALAGPSLASGTEDKSPPRSLEVWPPKAKLSGPAASQRLIVVGVYADGSRRDLTSSATVVSTTPAVAAVDPAGKIIPKGDGAGRVVVKASGVEAEVPVEVTGSTSPRRVSFRHEVEPVLTKLGCNMGACHGGQHGKGGFKLSLLGFEAAPDHTAIVKSAESRRITPFAPDESLLLLKPTLAVAHGGGKRLEAGSAEYEMIRLWLEQGAPAPDEAEPNVDGFIVYPTAG